MAVPGIASTILLNVILAWNEAFWTIRLTTTNAAPLTAFIASFSSPQGLFWAKLSAASTVAIAPIVILGWFSQKQLVRGLTFGAVKQGTRRWVASTLQNVSKTFGEVSVIPSIDLEINDGEFAVFVGPSGCGKSTLLRLIAGLEVTSGGMIRSMANATGGALAARDRHGVPVLCALSAHGCVHNMAFRLEDSRRHPRPKSTRGSNEAARILQLETLLKRRPRELSGGQRQRVAIGRAIVREPQVFLFDEPLSNLDAALRVNMRVEIAKLAQELKATMIYVTHDQVEAMTMADRSWSEQAPAIEQVGTPDDLYLRPASLFVAGFIGSPKMNLISGPKAQEQGAHTMGVRPEHMTLSTTEGAWKGKVTVAEHLGSDTFLHIATEEFGTITARCSGEMPVRHGDIVYATPDENRIHRFDERGLAL